MGDPYDTAAERMSVLPRTLRFKGELSADEDLVIQGSIEGLIHHTQRVTIGAEGNVKASISAQVIRVEGTVEGDLQAEKSVYIDETGTLRGNIRAPSVCLVEGSHFNGSVEMEQRPVRTKARPEGTERAAPAERHGTRNG